MLWLWLDTAWELTFARIPEDGSYQIGVIGTLGAEAFNAAMTAMQLEMPMLTIAQQVIANVPSPTACDTFYVG